MRPRAIVVEDEYLIRSVLARMLQRCGYEVFVYSDPICCPLYTCQKALCGLGKICADVIVSDVNMPGASGLQFVEQLRERGCAVRNIALISAGWSDAGIRRARQLNCRVFDKPIRAVDLYEWLDACERNMDPDRVLSEWPEKYSTTKSGGKQSARHLMDHAVLSR